MLLETAELAAYISGTLAALVYVLDTCYPFCIKKCAFVCHMGDIGVRCDGGLAVVALVAVVIHSQWVDLDNQQVRQIHLGGVEHKHQQVIHLDLVPVALATLVVVVALSA